MQPNIDYVEHATNNEDPIIRYDEIQNALICNTYRPGSKIIKKARIKGKQSETSKFTIAAKKMILEAMYRAIPSYKGMSQEDFSRKIDKATDRLIGEHLE
jgi:hypothetical protein